MADFEFLEKTVVVTGGNSGIGAAIASAFAKRGARLVIHYLGKQNAPILEIPYKLQSTVYGISAAEKIAETLEKQGGRVTLFEGDLAETSVISALIDHALTTYGRVDVLVNNAAHCETPDSIFSISASSFDRHFSVNARAAVLLIAEVIRRVDKASLRDARIINVSTDAAQSFASQITYGASKAALEAFTRSIAHEIGPIGMTINTVAPGPVQTGYITKELEQELLNAIPMGRIGTPADIAQLVVFLASKGAQWLTGQVIRVNGGQIL